MKLNPPLLALAAGAFGIGVTEFAPMGLLPIIANDLGVSIPTAGLLISAYALGVVKIGEDPARRAQIGLTFCGDRQGARRAKQQPHAEPRLDPVDRPADRRGAEPQQARRGGEAALLDDGDEHRQ